MRLKWHRSLIDWDDDGNVTDYGWHVTLFVRGRHRACWHSTRNTTPMWPHVWAGADENCNRSWSVMLWPLGHLDVWWETHWREDGAGMCDDCKAEFEEMSR